MDRLFGTDGIRGKAGAFPLDERTVRTIGRSLAARFRENEGREPKFVTGRDTRESGGWIEEAFHAGAVSAGALCESAGVITTPGVAWLTKARGFDAGIVISASHNPFEDNGIKVFLPNGMKLDEATERDIERDIAAGSEDMREAAAAADRSKEAEYTESYLDHLRREFEGLSLEGMHLVVDCANGAASGLAPRLFESFGARVTAIGDRPDGKNINRDCGSLHLENLRGRLVAEKADFGVAFDGDADRSLFVDERGELVDGDATLWIMAQHLQDAGRLEHDLVVATVMSNLGLEVALGSRNIELRRTQVGDKYVLRELLETGASVGGEQSGHIIFPERSLVGDGMQTALFLLQALRGKGVSLSEMRDGFRQFPQVLVNVRVREKRPFDDVPEIAGAARRVEDELGRTGRLLLRYSGTENLARVMIEGRDQAEIEEQAGRLAGVIEKVLG